MKTDFSLFLANLKLTNATFFSDTTYLSSLTNKNSVRHTCALRFFTIHHQQIAKY